MILDEVDRCLCRTQLAPNTVRVVGLRQPGIALAEREAGRL